MFGRLLSNITKKANAVEINYCLTAEQEEKISKFLEELAVCESGNNPEAINPYDGGSPSYGLLQFKIGTLVAYARRYNLYSATEDREFMNLIFDREVQIKVASAMLRESWDNRSHWKNCTINIENKRNEASISSATKTPYRAN